MTNSMPKPMPNPLPRPTPAMLRAAEEIRHECDECDILERGRVEVDEIAAIIARCLSEDVCEWRWTPSSYKTQCGESSPYRHKDWKCCPYCTAKLLVTEVRDGE